MTRRAPLPPLLPAPNPRLPHRHYEEMKAAIEEYIEDFGVVDEELAAEEDSKGVCAVEREDKKKKRKQQLREQKDKLIEDIMKRKVFGVVPAKLWVIEFQKRGLPHAPIPDLAHCIEHNLMGARLTNPACRMVGVSVNTAALAADDAAAYLEETEARLGLPSVDPIRGDIGRIVDNLP